VGNTKCRKVKKPRGQFQISKKGTQQVVDPFVNDICGTYSLYNCLQVVKLVLRHTLQALEIRQAFNDGSQ